MSATSPTNAWLAGYVIKNVGLRTLAMHWDGASWKVVPTPNSALGEDSTFGPILSLSSSDVWAAGDEGGEEIAAHWNGAEWSLTPITDPDPAIVDLVGLGAASPDDVWAVGRWFPQTGPNRFSASPLIEHWDGSTWTNTPQPVDGPGELNGVAVISTDDVWAVGGQTLATRPHGATLVEHWDGSAWSVVPSPVRGGSDVILTDVAARAANDVWAVGGTRQGFGLAIIEHWDGMAWTAASVTGLPRGSLYALAVSLRGRAWAAGYRYVTKQVPGGSETFPVGVLDRLRPDGAWVPSPRPKELVFGGIAAAGHSVLWRVGNEERRDDTGLIAVKCTRSSPFSG